MDSAYPVIAAAANKPANIWWLLRLGKSDTDSGVSPWAPLPADFFASNSVNKIVLLIQPFF
jgi:hypothetical protein